MFGQTFIYKRLHVSTETITEHTCRVKDLLEFLKQLNKWNAESSTQRSKTKLWVYWTEDLQEKGKI
jgi:hypothetical protein